MNTQTSYDQIRAILRECALEFQAMEESADPELDLEAATPDEFSYTLGE
jgi:hypothetical protein